MVGGHLPCCASPQRHCHCVSLSRRPNPGGPPLCGAAELARQCTVGELLLRPCASTPARRPPPTLNGRLRRNTPLPVARHQPSTDAYGAVSPSRRAASTEQALVHPHGPWLSDQYTQHQSLLTPRTAISALKDGVCAANKPDQFHGADHVHSGGTGRQQLGSPGGRVPEYLHLARRHRGGDGGRRLGRVSDRLRGGHRRGAVGSGRHPAPGQTGERRGGCWVSWRAAPGSPTCSDTARSRTG